MWVFQVFKSSLVNCSYFSQFLLLQEKCSINSENEAIKNRQILSFIATKLGCKFKIVSHKAKETTENDANLDVVHTPPKLEDLVPRPPVVAIVGHIDHGKYVLELLLAHPLSDCFLRHCLH